MVWEAEQGGVFTTVSPEYYNSLTGKAKGRGHLVVWLSLFVVHIMCRARNFRLFNLQTSFLCVYVCVYHCNNGRATIAKRVE